MSRTYMSFGGGVQSTAIAMLALHRDPRLLQVTDGRIPEMYLFADTGDERQETYAQIWEMAERITAAGFEFLCVHKESLSDHIIQRSLSGKRGVNALPFWVQAKDGTPAPARRGCTGHYKVKQLDKAAKKYWNVRRKQGVRGGFLEEPVQQWLGISYDEMQRLKTSDVQWRIFFYPLVEMRWTRSHCLDYLHSIGVSSARSSCVFCPFHGSKEWRAVQSNPEDWSKVLQMDRALEQGFALHGHVAGLRSRPFLTHHQEPIDTIDFSDNQLSLFDIECFGVCNT